MQKHVNLVIIGVLYALLCLFVVSLSWFGYNSIYKPLTADSSKLPIANPYSVPTSRVESALLADNEYVSAETNAISIEELSQLPTFFIDADTTQPQSQSEPSPNTTPSVGRPNLDPTL